MPPNFIVGHDSNNNSKDDVYSAVVISEPSREFISHKECRTLGLQQLSVLCSYRQLKVKGVYSWFTESHSYGTSLAIWNHTVLPATRPKWTRPALTPASKPVLDLHIPEVWKAELTSAMRQCTGRESNARPLDLKSDVVTTTLLASKLYQPWYRHRLLSLRKKADTHLPSHGG